MSVVSVRFSSELVRERLRTASRREGASVSALAEQLIDEGLRMRNHPRIVFRDGPSGRRAGLWRGPDVVEVLGTLVGGEVPPEDRVARTAELLSLSVEDVDAVLRYYGEFAEELDAALAAREEFAREQELMWRRGQELTAR
jgi:hypothetical protein